MEEDDADALAAWLDDREMADVALQEHADNATAEAKQRGGVNEERCDFR